ncbi:MAG: hypothetical protein K2G99_00065, partial [Desulfovibrio sp.]|nr:hypothetical protein [Desulfovibrio sp.]
SPWSLTLVRPRLVAGLAEPLGNPEELGRRLRALLDSPGGEAPASPLAFLDGSCRLEITQGAARVSGADGAGLSLGGLQCRLKGSPSGEVEGSLQFSSLRYAQAENRVASIERLRLEGEGDLSAPLTATPDARLGATLHVPDFPGPVRLSLGFTGRPGGWNGTFDLASDLDLGGPGGELIPLSVAGTAALPHGGRDVQLRGVPFALGPARGRLD